MFEISDANQFNVQAGARIKVIGVGGGGCNAVNTMIRAGLSGVEYIVANTDAQALNASLAPTKVQLGSGLTKGLGAGANPEVGRKAALDEYERLSEVLQDSDMVFITAGMGGGTGTGAAPVIAKLAKELGALTVGVVTKPFVFEGKKRMNQATNGIKSLEENVDSLITIPNQRLLFLAGESLSLVETFKKADEVLLNAVRGISDLINNTGHINADFADVSTVMRNKGLALMGTGTCNGPDRAVKAATEAISSPLLEDITIDGATGIIINITGNESLTMHETNEAVTLIMEAADENAEIIFGTVIDNNMGDAVKVTVIATGLGGLQKVTSVNVTEVQSPRIPQPQVQQQIQQPVYVQPTQPRVAQPEPVIARDNIDFSIEQVANNIEQSLDEANAIHEEVMPKAAEPQRPSSLVQSIKEAANRYEAAKVKMPEVQVSKPKPREVAPEMPKTISTARAKSIAEKLGFINFDEDELDTPSFMRNQDNKSDDNFLN